MSNFNPAEGLSDKARKKLTIMASSGTTEGSGVADVLNTIAENGGHGDTNQASDDFLLTCAQEIIDWAQSFIDEMNK